MAIRICFFWLILMNSSLYAQQWKELYDQADAYWGNDWKSCSEYLEKALLVAKDEIGKVDSVYALIQNDLALCYQNLGDYSKAETLFLQSLSTTEKSLGKEHLDYGLGLFNLGLLYQTTHAFEKALEVLKMTADNYRKNLGEEDPEYGLCLRKIGEIYKQLGAYSQSQSYLQLSLVLLEKDQANHPENYLVNLAVLGLLYQETGEFDKALPLTKQALTVAREQIGPESPYAIHYLQNLGLLYQRMGAYEKALPIYLESLEQEETVLGTEQPSYGYILNNLGELYKLMGAQKEAISYGEKALAHTEKTLGTAHPLYGARLRNLATRYVDAGDMQKAKTLFQESLTVIGNSLGKAHTEYSMGLNNLAMTYEHNGEYRQAQTLYQEALETNQKIFGEGSPNTAVNLHNLAHLSMRQENFQEALTYYQQAISITEKHLGIEHKQWGIWQNKLGTTYELLGEHKKASQAFLSANQNIDFQIRLRTSSLNEQLQASFLTYISDQMNDFHSFTLRHPDQPELVGEFCNNQLLLKGFIQDNNKHLLDQVRSSNNQDLQNLFSEWESIYRELALQYQKASQHRLPYFDSLVQRAEHLEVQLANASLAFKQSRSRISWQDVQSQLSPGEVAIEFAHFPYIEKGKRSQRILYVALLMYPDSSSPKLVQLFEENEILSLLEKQRQGSIQTLYAQRGIQPKSQPSLPNNLYDLIWKPLQTHLSGIHTIYFAQTGILHRINMAAIPWDEQRILSDVYSLIPLGSSRQLLYEEQPSHDSNRRAVLFGGIQYTREQEMMLSQHTPAYSDISLSNLVIASRGRTKEWTYLTGTKEEVDQLAQLLPRENFDVELLTGNDARESRFYEWEQSPRILHIATHGYFFPDPKAHRQDSPFNQAELPPIQLSEHPMVRSGLILAGANHAWAGNPVSEGQEDGILTAYEISRMDLSNTELVVLSACETGLGDIEGNEGVYGLQRAFKIAGVKYILMSLWQVPDQATQELMTAFYEKWLGGMEIRAALQAAQKQMRKKYNEPYYWAGFVLVE